MSAEKVPCGRCDSSGSVEGPEQGWYELECPACCGAGMVDTGSRTPTDRADTSASRSHSGSNGDQS